MVAADLIIAADGLHSIAVEQVLGHPHPAEVPTGTKANSCYRFLIPKADVDSDPETRSFNESPQSVGCRVWADLAGKKRLISYPCREYVSLVIFCCGCIADEGSYEVLNFIVILRDEEVTSTREGRQWSPILLEKKLTTHRLAGVGG